MPVHAADALAGFLAGSCSVFVGHPFDTIRVRAMATVATARTAGVSSSGVLVDLVRKDGFLALWSGIIPPLASAGLVSTIAFSANEFARRKLASYSFLGPELQLFLAGAFAGVCTTTISCPSTTVKVMLQTQGMVPKTGATAESAPRSASAAAWSATREMGKRLYREQGLRGFYRVVGPQLVVEGVGRGAYFSAYPLLKDALARLRERRTGAGAERGAGSGSPSSSPLWERMLAGAASGCAGWMAIYPVDVVKTRLQAGFSTSFWECARASYAREGAGVFFRGLGVSLVRAAPVSMVALPVYDVAREYLITALVP